jgi:hypothetical protein
VRVPETLRGPEVYFRITKDATELVEPENVTAFSVVVPDGLPHDDLAAGVRQAGLGELLPGDTHVMVRVEAIRRFAAGRVGDGWESDLAGMLAYATKKGWTDESGEHVRAHVERRD